MKKYIFILVESSLGEGNHVVNQGIPEQTPEVASFHTTHTAETPGGRVTSDYHKVQDH